MLLIKLKEIVENSFKKLVIDCVILVFFFFIDVER